MILYMDNNDKHPINPPDCIIIKGVTESGEEFRPNDWAERMSGKLSTLRNHRLHYSPLLQPVIKDGHKCVLLDKRLQQSNPKLYNSILEFARDHKLKICDNKKPPPTPPPT